MEFQIQYKKMQVFHIISQKHQVKTFRIRF